MRVRVVEGVYLLSKAINSVDYIFFRVARQFVCHVGKHVIRDSNRSSEGHVHGALKLLYTFLKVLIITTCRPDPSIINKGSSRRVSIRMRALSSVRGKRFRTLVPDNYHGGVSVHHGSDSKCISKLGTNSG